jgi:hypothetical protein
MKLLIVIGILLASVQFANATMPMLTPVPTKETKATRNAWAGKQDADVICMWGLLDSGVSWPEVAKHRLTDFCTGLGKPEIVGFGSSAGFERDYCAKYPTVRICKMTIRVADGLGPTFEDDPRRGDRTFNGYRETRQAVERHCCGVVGIAPKDELEGMIAAQLIACHNAAMECYRRAMIGEQSFEGRRENLSQAKQAQPHTCDAR